MSTCQNILDSARIPLNDADKTRYPDTELLGYLCDGVALAYSMRPDLLYGTYGTAPVTTFATTDTFPLPAQHGVALQHYIVFRAETKDDENVNENREQKSYALFQAAIMKT